MEVAAGILERLWRPASLCSPSVAGPPIFATLAGWARGFERLRTEFGGSTGPFRPALVDRADGLFRELLGTGGEPALIHGDLHPVNILRAERELRLAIDPKGVVGNPLYDVATFLNSVELTAPAETRARLGRRAGQVADRLGLDRPVLAGWGLAQAMLSAWWSYEDHGRGWEGAVSLAEAWAAAYRL